MSCSGTNAGAKHFGSFETVPEVAKLYDWSISVIRLFAMCLIVSCHFCQAYGFGAAWYLNIGVQVFLVISGYLFGKAREIDFAGRWYVKRLRRILIPYYLVFIFLLLANAIFAQVEIDAKTVVLGFTCLRPGSIPNGEHLWYIAVILLCYLLTPLLGVLWKRGKALVVLMEAALMLLVGKLILPQGQWTACYIIAFALGRAVRDGLSEKQAMKYTFVLSGAGAVLVAFTAVLCDCLELRMPTYLLQHLLCGFILFSGAKLVMEKLSIAPSKSVCRLLKLSDDYSYEVYLVHQVFILGSFTVLFSFPLPVVGILAAISLSLLSAVILHKISQFLLGKL